MARNESLRGSFRFSYDPLHGEKEAPDATFRPLIAAAAERFERYGPEQLKAFLDYEGRHEGRTVPIEQIRGFLAGM